MKPEAPVEILEQIHADLARSNFTSFGYESSIDPKVWDTYRRPDFGPERNLTTMEKSRKKFFEEAVSPELNQIRKHIPALWDRFFSEQILKNTVFGKNKKLSPVAAQPLPQGYINYDNNEIETLPEQELLRLVGYDHLHMALAGFCEI